MRRPVKISIAYCIECGYQPYAMSLAEALLNELQLMLTGVELVPWTNGAFDVRVDGELVHSMYRDGGFPEPETIATAARARMEAPAN
jgi:selenoprotein W-related protein